MARRADKQTDQYKAGFVLEGHFRTWTGRYTVAPWSQVVTCLLPLVVSRQEGWRSAALISVARLHIPACDGAVLSPSVVSHQKCETEPSGEMAATAQRSMSLGLMSKRKPGTCLWCQSWLGPVTVAVSIQPARRKQKNRITASVCRSSRLSILLPSSHEMPHSCPSFVSLAASPPALLPVTRASSRTLAALQPSYAPT